MAKSLLDETYELLDQSNETWREICEGSGVNYHWLNKFAGRQFNNPGLARVEALHRYLSRQKREAAA